jgi:hypothetical protein
LQKENFKFSNQKFIETGNLIDSILSNRFASSQNKIISIFGVLFLFSNLEILRETGLEKNAITANRTPLTSSRDRSNLNPPFEEARRPDGRPAERHLGGNGKADKYSGGTECVTQAGLC